VSVQVYGGLQRMELYFWWEQPRRGVRVPLGDRFAARALLARLQAQGSAPALRRLAGEQPLAARLGEDELLAQLADWIVAGTLRVAVWSDEHLWAKDGEEEEPPAPELPWIVQAEEPVAPVEEPLRDDLDQVAMAEVLREAAKEGVPFCEECEKAKRKRQPPPDDVARLDQAEQAATLTRAAQMGTPFCEECARRAPRAAEVSHG
jgi:hypothetical protein